MAVMKVFFVILFAWQTTRLAEGEIIKSSLKKGAASCLIIATKSIVAQARIASYSYTQSCSMHVLVERVSMRCAWLPACVHAFRGQYSEL